MLSGVPGVCSRQGGSMAVVRGLQRDQSSADILASQGVNLRNEQLQAFPQHGF